MKMLLTVCLGLIPMITLADTRVCREDYGVENLGLPVYELSSDSAEWSYLDVSNPIIKEISYVTEIWVGTAVRIKGHENSLGTSINVKAVIVDSKIEFGVGVNNEFVDKIFYSIRIFTEGCTINTRGEYRLN